jgi:DNA-binding IclR family transcriptional regulator
MIDLQTKAQIKMDRLLPGMDMDTTGKSENSKAIKSIVKAAALVDLLAESERPLSLAAISKASGIAKSTLHGILATLISVGYVTQDEGTGNYRLGYHLFELGNRISGKIDERRIARPYMKKLSEITGETVHLAVLDEGEVLYIDKQESKNSIRIVTETGVKLPVHCTGVGKALLSGLDPYKIKEIVRKKGMEKYTETTITDADKLLAEIEKIKKQGFATDQQEFMIGLRCIAIPVFNHAEKVACAISISGPISRMSGAVFESKKKHLIKAAHEISKKMGYGGYSA